MRPAVLFRTALAMAAVACLAGVALAQPDPRQMSGIPRPDSSLPDGTITVRVIRGSFANNVADHPVELRQGDQVSTALTDEQGRAHFAVLSSGVELQAFTTLDGQRMESQRFAAPSQGGVALMFVGAATGDPGTEAVPAQPGRVTFGDGSRILIELGEETVEVYYLFDIVNPAAAPVEPPAPLVIDMPAGAVSTTILPNSAPNAVANLGQVTVSGPFRPGTTPLTLAYVLPYTGDSVAITQVLPVDLADLFVIMERRDNLDIRSSQIARKAEEVDDRTGATFLFGVGPSIPAGQPIALEVTGLPHHSLLPSRLAMLLAAVLLMVGIWASLGSAESSDRRERRRTLEARREKLFADLVKNETQHQAGKIGPTKYASRRRDLVAALERIFAEMDDQVAPIVLTSPRPVGRETPVPGGSRSAG